jgi:hypothetical protein
MNKIIFTLLISLTAQICLAQGTTGIKAHLDNIANGKSSSISKKDMMAYYTESGVIAILEPYLQSGNEKVQREAVRLCTRIGANHVTTSSRQLAVRQLLAITDTAPIIIVRQIARGLQRFKPGDFDKDALNKVSGMVRKEQAHQDKWIELAGFLHLKEVLDEVKYTYQNNKNLHQKIGIALTRCGDESKKENLMKNIQKAKVNDEFVYGVVPLLVYTRQKETMGFLFDIILSNEKSCTPAGPDIKGNIECGYRVMEAIAPYVKGIPLELSASGDLKTDDYKKTLKDTREWIKANRSSYELITDIY